VLSALYTMTVAVLAISVAMGVAVVTIGVAVARAVVTIGVAVARAVLAMGVAVARAVVVAMGVVHLLFIMDRNVDSCMDWSMDSLMDWSMNRPVMGGLNCTVNGSVSNGVHRVVISDEAMNRLMCAQRGVVAIGTVLGGEVVSRDVVLHLATEEDLREAKTDRMAELIEVLVVPLSLSVRDLVVNILAIDDKIVLNVEDEVPRVREGLGHLAELVKIGADGSLALFELVGDIMEDMTEVFDGV
jgi:hypothetical protein